MGSLISGIAGLIEGDPTQKQQNELGDLGLYGSKTGEGAVNAAQGYYGGILSGDPAQIAETLAPEIKANQDQAQQEENKLAQFGTRSGGTTSAAAGIDSASRANIINLIGQTQANAAGAEAGLGTTLLSQGATDINNQAALAEKARQQQLSEIGGVATGAGQIVSDLFNPTGVPGVGTGSTPSIDESAEWTY
jgi:hypothetical protein